MHGIQPGLTLLSIWYMLLLAGTGLNIKCSLPNSQKLIKCVALRLIGILYSLSLLFSCTRAHLFVLAGAHLFQLVLLLRFFFTIALLICMQIRPDRQTLYWSATWPKEVEQLARQSLYNPYKVRQFFYAGIILSAIDFVKLNGPSCAFVKLRRLVKCLNT